MGIDNLQGTFHLVSLKESWETETTWLDHLLSKLFEYLDHILQEANAQEKILNRVW